jgi:hypothetical protein
MVEGAGEMVGEHHRVKVEVTAVEAGSRNSRRLLALVRSMQWGRRTMWTTVGAHRPVASLGVGAWHRSGALGR